MRYAAVLIGLIAVLVFVGCGDKDPVSSVSEEGINAPAGKLTVSATKAGGYLGKNRLRLLYGSIHHELYEQNLDQFMAYFADDAEYDYVAAPTPMTTKEEIRTFFDEIFFTWPDFHATSELLLMAGNIVVTEHPTTATQLGEWVEMGIPATGNVMDHIHLDIWEFEGNEIKKVTTYLDVVPLLVASGAMPAAEFPPLVPSFELPLPEPTGMSPAQATREAVRRWNTQDLALYAKMIRPDATIAQAGIPMDRDTYVAAMDAIYYTAFPDGKLEITRLVDMGDGWVMFEMIFNGTHQGNYLGVPPTELPIVNRLVGLYRVDEDGVLTHMANYFDNLGVLMQMGAFPPP